MLELDAFLPTIGQRFAAGPVELELVEASSSGSAPAPELRAPFRLEFRGPPEPVLEQRIHRLEHEAMGALEIFLVPVARDGAGTTYEAVFA